MAFDLGNTINGVLQNLLGGQTGAQQSGTLTPGVTAPGTTSTNFNPYVNNVSAYSGPTFDQGPTNTLQKQYLQQYGTVAPLFNQGGTGSGGSPASTGGSPAPSGPSPEQQLFNQTLQQYNSIYGDLLSGLDPQKAAQEAIVNNNFTQGQSDLNAARDQGLADLSTQQRKTQENTANNLRDLTNNIRNQTLAGQVYLGARGAGDSSAADQYSYALTQLGNKARGNVLGQQTSIFNDIGDRQAKLNNIYTQELSKLQTDKANGLQSIAQWYADAQNQIKSQRGQNVAQLSQQALNYALGQLQSVNQQIASRRAALDQWAVNSAQTLQQAQSNLQNVANYNAPGITTPLYSTGIGGFTGGTGGGYYPGSNGSNQQYDIFGNPIS